MGECPLGVGTWCSTATCKPRATARNPCYTNGLEGAEKALRQSAASGRADPPRRLEPTYLFSNAFFGRGRATSMGHAACNCFYHRAMLGAPFPRDVEGRAVRHRRENHRGADGERGSAVGRKQLRRDVALVVQHHHIAVVPWALQQRIGADRAVYGNSFTARRLQR